MSNEDTREKNSKEDEKVKSEDLVRKPRQARSKETKGKILKTASKLFCENGFYKTTTNEIAKQAGVPIGSLYSYFKNKDMILIEILEEYHQTFIERVNSLSNPENIEIAKNDKKAWIQGIIKTLIDIHMETKDLNLELQALKSTIPEVYEFSKSHDLNTIKRIKKEFEIFKAEIKATDLDAAAIVVNELISAIVHRIVFNENIIETQRIITAGVEAIYKYLFCSSIIT